MIPRDIPAVLPVLFGRARYQRVWKQIPELLLGLLKAGSLQNKVLFGDDRVIGFGSAVFVTDDLVTIARTSQCSIVLECIVRHLGGDSPILTPPQIRAANSRGGLISLRFLVGYDYRNLSPEDAAMAANRLSDAFDREVRGYKLRMLLAEVTEDDPPGLCERVGGLKLGPNVVGIDREMAIAHPASWLAHTLLGYQPPRFYFESGQQELLKLALEGLAENQIAATLDLTADGVKKRWSSIYSRVRHAAGDLPGFQFESRGLRGPEKRRQLLHYLRDHPEELRPCDRV